MFGSDILDIAIGLVLIYLIFSILMTSVTEAIESLLKTRAGQLEHAIAQLMQGDQSLVEQFYKHPLINALYRGEYPDAPPAKDGGEAVAPSKPRRFTQLPSYIPREIFSAAMIDMLKGAPEQAEKLHAAIGAAAPGLTAALDEAAIDPASAAAASAVADFSRKRRELEAWFDGAMDRASGAFKRKTHARLFVLGLGIALVCNVNSVVIGQFLATHKPALEATVALAKRVGDSAPVSVPAPDEAPAPGGDDAPDGSEARDAWLRDYQRQLQDVGLPIGWTDATVARVMAGLPGGGSTPFGKAWALWILSLVMLAFGYLATAFAVTLGAPFWFDLLGRLMVVRSTVKPDQKSPDEPPMP
jgi:hypothetical protein